MLRAFVSLFLVVAVLVADALTLRWFLGRLRKIQEDLWGKENVKPFRIAFAFRRGQPAKG